MWKPRRLIVVNDRLLEANGDLVAVFSSRVLTPEAESMADWLSTETPGKTIDQVERLEGQLWEEQQTTRLLLRRLAALEAQLHAIHLLTKEGPISQPLSSFTSEANPAPEAILGASGSTFEEIQQNML